MEFPQFNQLAGANTAVSPFLQAENSPTILSGVNHVQKLGALRKEPGYFRVGDVASAAKAVTGLYNFRQSSATQKILRTKNTDAGTALKLQYNNAGTWADINVGTTYDLFEDCATEFETFIGYAFIVGYDATDGVYLPSASLTGTTFSETTNVTDMPDARFIKRYRDRIYLANCRYGGVTYEYRIYFSSTPTAGAITWTPATDFIDVDFADALTGLGTNWDRLLAFTENSCYIYDQASWKKSFDTGCASNRTIQTKGTHMYWCDYDAVWDSEGGQPKAISGPVQDFIKNGTPRNFFSTIVDEEYRMYVGTVTVDGVTWTNCELIFNIPTSTWRWRELGHAQSVYAQYNSSGKIRHYMGSTLGEVWDRSKYTDATIYGSDGWISVSSTGVPISANFELAPMFFNTLTKEKGIKKLIAFADRAQGLVLKYRVVDKNLRALTPYRPLGQLKDYMSTFDISSAADGVMLQIAGNEYSKNPYFSFYGFALDIQPTSQTLKNANNS